MEGSVNSLPASPGKGCPCAILLAALAINPASASLQSKRAGIATVPLRPCELAGAQQSALAVYMESSATLEQP
jgi:hypothetical protein